MTSFAFWSALTLALHPGLRELASDLTELLRYEWNVAQEIRAVDVYRSPKEQVRTLAMFAEHMVRNDSLDAVEQSMSPRVTPGVHNGKECVHAFHLPLVLERGANGETGSRPVSRVAVNLPRLVNCLFYQREMKQIRGRWLLFRVSPRLFGPVVAVNEGFPHRCIFLDDFMVIDGLPVPFPTRFTHPRLGTTSIAVEADCVPAEIRFQFVESTPRAMTVTVIGKDKQNKLLKDGRLFLAIKYTDY